MDVVPLLERFGFPVALAIYLLWRSDRERKECTERHDQLQQQIDTLRGGPPPRSGKIKLYVPPPEE